MTGKRRFESSELIINGDGSVFHLHLKPGDLARKIILVGDPGRVQMVAKHFDKVEARAANREFHSATGTCKGCRMTVLSTGIGCDNIDIVLNELDALVNIDFDTREEKQDHTSLEILRIGTCGGLQPTTPLGAFICSAKSIGLDGLLNYYQGRDEVCDLELENAFKRHMQWSPRHCAPYVAKADRTLLEAVARDDMLRGVTISAAGFYGPQGRQLRLALSDPLQNAKLQSFNWQGQTITNYEMESSAIAGLSSLLGHKALTVCMVIANRQAGDADTDYTARMDMLVDTALGRLADV